MTVREEITRAQTSSEERTTAIAALNDRLRCQGRGGTLCATAGVIALGPDALPAVLAAVRGYTAFTDDNDPHRERDFGAITWRGHRLFWKIECYDRDMRFGSPDAADASVTSRILTVMLAEEW